MNKVFKWIGSILLISAVHFGSVEVGNAQGRVGCGTSISSCASTPVQGNFLFNTQTTGAATTAVTVTLVAVPGARIHIHSVEARCNTAAATTDVLVSDGGTTIWSTQAAIVTTTGNFIQTWPTPLTAATGNQVLVTLAACTAGTGTLIVQADKY